MQPIGFESTGISTGYAQNIPELCTKLPRYMQKVNTLWLEGTKEYMKHKCTRHVNFQGSLSQKISNPSWI